MAPAPPAERAGGGAGGRARGRTRGRCEAGDEALGEPRVLRNLDALVFLATAGRGRRRTWVVANWAGGGVGMIASGLAGSMAAKLVNLLEVHAGYGRVRRVESQANKSRRTQPPPPPVISCY